MTILESAPKLLEALQGEMTPKFLATRSAEAIPNIVPCVSLLPDLEKPDILFFGNFLLRKSIKNLESDPRVAILVITEQLNGWILKAKFLEFQRSGAYVDRQKSGSLLRYNAYTGVRNAGLIKVESLVGGFKISKMQVALAYLKAWLSSPHNDQFHSVETTQIPQPVQKEFARMIAVKVLAWIDQDDYPVAVPALSMQPKDDQRMLGHFNLPNLPLPPNDARVATNILTFEAISYQAKGIWQKIGKHGVVHVQEIYAGGPPYPGGRVA